jgi:predicted regulator of Ras-like GTPase activity (Roadblock/LC7/MglB family)
LPAVDAAQALADLVEISSQIESAVLAGADGTVLASTLADDERAGAIARDGLELLSGVPGEPTQVHASLAEGSVFAVRDEERVVVAVTGRDPTAGLVLYDLKTCLRLAAEEAPEEKAASASGTRRKRAKKSEPAEEGEAGDEA